MKLSNYEQTLLEGWEETHKKGQLTFWMLFSLYESGKHMSGIKEWVYSMTHGTITADDQSMYRALRRLKSADIIQFENVPSTSGPDLKVYHLTDIGERVLGAFAKRNISSIYLQPRIRKLIQQL